MSSEPDPRQEASSQQGDGVAAILSPDSMSLGSDANTSASLPLVGTSSLKAPGDKVASEGKRKQEDDSDTALDAVNTSGTRKKLKLEASDVLLLRPAEAVSGTEAAVESPANNAELPASLGLDDESAHTGSGTAVSTLPGVPPTPTAPSNPPSSPISLRSLSAPPTSPIVTSVTHEPRPLPPPTSLPPEPEPLHTYACPICFASPTNATLTPCGHIMCGECLFTAVGAAVARMGIASVAARCPVCRAPIPMWDGRGGGVIGLQPRVVITI
ncbi:hypothetical protein EDB92DRAFT_1848667 [Lactarius akahatsu]|uniref:RING-type domain-containing protein n=1 Tax=Lactarius akahatsu TaxID=416441 RepID=A0AAD4QF97_9AGAM|nr:hypothetical protein EDB92DRAFT_1848667 [Lactarius akahatsu]